MEVDYLARIPNNVDLADNPRLLRALGQWQPKFLDWWGDMGPAGFQTQDIYLRTAVAVGAKGWAHFDYVKMPDYRWGIFLAEPEAERVLADVTDTRPSRIATTLVDVDRAGSGMPGAVARRAVRVGAGEVVLLLITVCRRPGPDVAMR